MPCKEIDKDGLLKGEMSPDVALLLFLAVFPASLNGFLFLCSVVFSRGTFGVDTTKMDCWSPVFPCEVE